LRNPFERLCNPLCSIIGEQPPCDGIEDGGKKAWQPMIAEWPHRCDRNRASLMLSGLMLSGKIVSRCQPALPELDLAS